MPRYFTFIILFELALLSRAFSQTLTVKTDTSCRFLLDGIFEKQLNNNDSVKINVAPGRHTIVANTLYGELNFRKEFTIDTSMLIQISFSEQIARVEKAKQEVVERKAKIDFFKIQKHDIIKDIIHNMMLIENGAFDMGSISGDEDEEPVRKVKVSSFYMSKHEVTQKQWMSIMENNPSHFHDRADCPVENISWYDAILFCNKLSASAGFTPYYIIDSSRADAGNLNFYDHIKWLVKYDSLANGFRLPTEAEWEYAASAPSNSLFAGSNLPGKVAWTLENSDAKTRPVGQKLPNKNNLYDMSGNVWEWCWDWYDYHYYEKSEDINPMGPLKGRLKVIRGGSWLAHSIHARVANRERDGADNANYFTGLRLVRNVQ